MPWGATQAVVMTQGTCCIALMTHQWQKCRFTFSHSPQEVPSRLPQPNSKVECPRAVGFGFVEV